MLAPLPAEVITLEGTKNLMLDCSGSGDPTPVTNWLRNGQILPLPGEHVSTINLATVMYRIAGNFGKVFSDLVILRKIAYFTLRIALMNIKRRG